VTAPSRTPIRPPDQDVRDDQVLAYEHALEAAALAGLAAAVAQAFAAATALLGTAVPIAFIRSRLADALRGLPVDVGKTLLDGWAQGATLGIEHSEQDVGRLPTGDRHRVQTSAGKPTKAARALARDADRELRAGLAAAAKAVEHAAIETADDLTPLHAIAVKSAARARAQVSWFAQSAVTEGVLTVAKEAGYKIVWVAERDACLTCFALSGETVEPGEEFDADLTYADHPMPLFPLDDPQPLLGPPRHGNCRCALRLVSDDPSMARMPGALHREAMRSVARGWSNYASKPARLRAADRLVQSGPALPTSVVERARRDVRRGDFSPRHNRKLPYLPPGR
jgi:hypothetical protein